MTQKLTEEQQRAAHKVIKANRGDCTKIDNYLNCHDCPWFKEKCTGEISDLFTSQEFQAENLRRSQAWLDEHITDAEIMAESPREFCERMVRTQGIGNCKPLVSALTCKNSSCVIHDKEKICGFKSCFDRAKAYLAAHPATPQEPPKRRPTPEEMVIGATVRVRLWDEMAADGKLYTNGIINFPKNNFSFVSDMKKYCGNTYKIIYVGNHFVHLDGCADSTLFFNWNFTPEMLDYVEPEKVVEPKAAEPVNFFDWVGNPLIKTTTEKKKSEFVAKGKVYKLPQELRFINFRDLLPVDGLRIVDLETKVKDLTKKLAASERKCDRLARRLRAKWEAARDGEMCTHGELDLWLEKKRGCAKVTTLWNMPNKYDSVPKDWEIRPNGRTDWIPATRGNLKL